MVEPILIFIIGIMVALFYVKFLEPLTANPALFECMSCGSRMYTRPRRVGAFIECLAWNLTADILVWRSHPSPIVGIGLLLLIVFPFVIAAKRIYHTYWLWRHPLRCGEGGHFKPAPVPT